MKERGEAQMDLAEKRQENLDKQENQAAAIRKAEAAVEKKLTEQLKGIAESQKQAFADAQAAFNKIESDYIGLRKNGRDSADMVAQAEDDLQLLCRQTAEKKFDEAEKVRTAAIALRKKNLGACSNVAGAAKRTKAAIARARAVDYTAFFNECVSGPTGVGGRNRIATAKRAKDSADKLIADQQALIEKQRSQMLQKLSQMEEDGKKEKSEVVESLNKELTKLGEDYTRVAKQNATAAALSEQKLQQRTENIDKELGEANKDLMLSQQKENLLETRLACAGSTGRRSETAKTKIMEGFQNARPSVESIFEACNRRTKSCDLSDSKDILECAKVTAIKEGFEIKDGKKVDRPKAKPYDATNTKK
jgi:hypothetical protein